MSEFSVDPFDGKGIRLALRNSQFARIVDQIGVDLILITEVLHTMWDLVDDSLEGVFALLPHDGPAHHTACVSLDSCHEVDAFFFVSMNVKSSSNSMVCRSSGKGASGS